MRLPLSMALSSNLRTRAVLEGRVGAEGVDLTITELHPSEMFWRQLKFAEFDVSEMSLSSLMMAIAGGDDRWVGLPIFTTRHFFQTWILIRRDAGIASPADLKGKRVGVPEYQQTAALWSRGALQHDWGVRPADMEFWMERTPELSHAGATGFTAPPGVTIRQIPPDKDIGSMMLARELDATLLYLASPNLVDRSRADLWRHPEISPLFPDPDAEGARYYRKHGIFPANHAMVVRRKVVESHPWVVLNLFRCFAGAAQAADEARGEHIAYHLACGAISAEAAAALRRPVLRHGVAANRTMLETAARFSYEQGLTPRLMPLEEIFAKNTLSQ